RNLRVRHHGKPSVPVARSHMTAAAMVSDPEGLTPRIARSIRREAVEEAGAAHALQGLRIAAGRAVRGVPRGHVPGGLLEAGAVGMTDDGRAFAALGPVAAGGVAAGGREHAL